MPQAPVHAEAPVAKEFAVGPLFDDSALIERHDAVHLGDGGQAVGVLYRSKT